MRKASRTAAILPHQFTALVQRDGKWFIAFCPEVPGANGQGRTKAACLRSLAEAIKLILEIQEEELASSCRNGVERTLIEVA
jgi:predicted RNase H-like HicB family nuclease